MTGAAPVIETARLRLRGFRADDLDAQAAAMGDPAVARHIGGGAGFDREETWRKMLTGPGMWALLGFGYWAVERRGDGAWLGQVGFADFKRAIAPSIEGLPEMGWIFAPFAQGQGHATEAVRAALAWAETALPGREVPAVIDPDNAASIRVAEKCGFAGPEPAVYKGDPVLLYRRRLSGPAVAAAPVPGAAPA